MSITMKDLKAIKSDLAKRKPPKPVLDVNRDLTTKEIITSLAPELTRMKSRGFSTQDLVDILKEHKINIKGATLNRYLSARQAEDKPSNQPTKPQTEEGVAGQVEDKPVV